MCIRDRNGKAVAETDSRPSGAADQPYSLYQAVFRDERNGTEGYADYHDGISGGEDHSGYETAGTAGAVTPRSLT